MGFNSPEFAVTAGNLFDFRAVVDSVSATGMYGSATVIWLDGNHHGFARTNISVGADVSTAVTATTDREGEFRFLPGAMDDGKGRVEELMFAGDANLRGAMLRLVPAAH